MWKIKLPKSLKKSFLDFKNPVQDDLHGTHTQNKYGNKYGMVVAFSHYFINGFNSKVIDAKIEIRLFWHVTKLQRHQNII